MNLADNLMLVIEPIFGMLWHLAPILVPFIVIVIILKSAWFKGWVGEKASSLFAHVRLPKDEYTILDNVTLPFKDGTTQVDQIVVSRFGIFVVEIKNMSGLIFATASDRKWTQVLGRKKTSFLNPLKQNHMHMKALEGIGANSSWFVSVIAFMGNAKFKNPMPENVCMGGQYLSYIKSFKQPLLSEQEVADVLRLIQTSRKKAGIGTHMAHVAHVKKKQAERSRPTNSKASSTKPAESESCPNCGKGLVIRKAKRGKHIGATFWGCSGFPGCRYVKQIT